MPGPNKHAARVLEPIFIADRGRWRVISVGPDGRRRSRERFPVEAGATDEERAWAYYRRAVAKLAQLGETTLEAAIDRYRVKYLVPKGNKPGAIDDTVYKIRTFFKDVLSLRVAGLSEDRGQVLYHGQWEGNQVIRHGLRNRPTARKPAEGQAQPCKLACKCEGEGPPLAADSHRNMLLEAKTFMRWCVTEAIIERSPLEAVKGEGKRRHGGLGHARLRPKEQRAWYRKAIELGEAGTAEQRERALGGLMSLLMAMRATEIVTRRVRDLDDEDWTLGVDKDAAKTDESVRTFEVPRALRPLFRLAIAGKSSDDFILGDGKRQHWRDWVRKSIRMVCRLAKVPPETAHGMRGAHASIAREAGATAELVSRQLGQRGTDTQERSYASKRAQRKGTQKAALAVLEGGRR